MTPLPIPTTKLNYSNCNNNLRFQNTKHALKKYVIVSGVFPQKIILNCFTSGLHPEIRRELAILNPYSISQAIGLAKLIEDKIGFSKPKTFRLLNLTNFQHPTTNNLWHLPLPPTTTTTQTNMNHPVVAHNPPPAPNLPIKRLTTAHLQKRRALSLCYNQHILMVLTLHCVGFNGVKVQEGGWIELLKISHRFSFFIKQRKIINLF